MSLVELIKCDGCEEEWSIQPGLPIPDARQKLALRGWENMGDHDYCRECMKKIARKELEGPRVGYAGKAC